MFDESKYTPTQKLIKDFVKQLSKSCDYLYFLENMKNDRFPEKFWQIIGEAGYIGLLSPEEYGGSNFDAEDLTAFIYQMAKKNLASYQLMNQITGCDLLNKFGSYDQKKSLIPKMIEGNLACLAITELSEGMNLYETGITAEKSGDSYVLNGKKPYVICAQEADWIIVAADAAPGGKQGLSLFCLERSLPGLRISPKEINVRVTQETELMTITGDTFYELAFDRVTVSEKDMIGDAGMGKECISGAADLIMLMMGAASAGWGDYVLDKAVDYAKKRIIYEEPIGAYQAVQHPLVRAKTELELSKLAVSRASLAYKNEENQNDISVYSNIAKYAATEAAYTAIDVSMQTHGGYSFDRETGMITLWPMILLSRIIPLNNDVILEAFSENALGLPREKVA